jgi:7-keto-8-aminopelargonate synthetase-like enzyme
VPKGGERLRITLSAAHHERDIDALLDALSANIPVATVQAT